MWDRPLSPAVTLLLDSERRGESFVVTLGSPYVEGIISRLNVLPARVTAEVGVGGAVLDT